MKPSAVISDSTTLITLINIGQLDLLKYIYEKVDISLAVYNEIACRDAAKQVLDASIASHFIDVKTINTHDHLLSSLMLQLDLGESESIILAIESKKTLIIDEKKGRNIAQSLNIPIIGLVGILYYLKIEKILSVAEINQILIKMEQHHFRISKKLVNYLIN